MLAYFWETFITRIKLRSTDSEARYTGFALSNGKQFLGDFFLAGLRTVGVVHAEISFIILIY